jgi:hypothetical protein
MVSSGMLCRVALVRTDVSEELSASFIRVTRIGQPTHAAVFLRSVSRLLVTASVVPSSPILVTLLKEVLRSSETYFLIRFTRRNIPEDAILDFTHLCSSLRALHDVTTRELPQFYMWILSVFALFILHLANA